MRNIGVLIPQSKAYPRIAKDFVEGLKLSLNESSEEYKLKIQGIGFANDPKVVIDAIQNLIMQEDVELITGLLGHMGINEICDFVQGMEEKLIYADLGATPPLDLSNRKGVYCNSLNMLESIKLLGEYFSDNELRSIAVSTCYYDAGYGFLRELENVLYSNGAEFAGHFITPLKPRENESELMKEFFLEIKPDAIFGSFNSYFSKEHAEFIEKNQVHKLAPLYTTQFSLDDAVLDKFPSTFNGVNCMSSWFPELTSPSNEQFIERYLSSYSKKPSVFAMLGYENGLLINDVLSSLDSGNVQQGPRGELVFDTETNRTISKHYLWRLKTEESGYSKSIVKEFRTDAKKLNYLSDEDTPNWFNAYLCH